MKILSKIISFVKQSQYPIFLAICMGLISFISFNLGHINALEKSPLKVGERSGLKSKNSDLKADIYSATTDNQQQPTNNPKKLDTRVVVSKFSTSKKYHYSWCVSGKRITAINQFWFENEAAAIAAGYTLAGNCTK